MIKNDEIFNDIEIAITKDVLDRLIIALDKKGSKITKDIMQITRKNLDEIFKTKITIK